MNLIWSRQTTRLIASQDPLHNVAAVPGRSRVNSLLTHEYKKLPPIDTILEIRITTVSQASNVFDLREPYL